MNETKTGTVPEPTSPQDEQFKQWAETVSRKIAEHGTRFSELPDKMRAELIAQFQQEVAKVSDQVEEMQSFTRKRFKQLAEHYQAGGDYIGPFADREQAKAFGALCWYASMRSPDAEKVLDAMGITPATGAGGGVLVMDTLLAGFANRLPQYGVFEADNPAVPARHGAQVLNRFEGFVMYHPDFEAAPTLSTTTFGAKRADLVRYSIATAVDRWMMREQSLVPLGDVIAEGMLRLLAKRTDLYGFHGDGTGANARVTGIFNWEADADYTITADSGHDTFVEVIDQSVKYLSRCIGAMPEEYDDGNAKWYGHRTIFFRYLGIRDSNGRPFADIVAMDRITQFMLLGAPFRFVRQAPTIAAATQADKVMLCYANLPAAFILARDPNGVEIRQSEEVKFLEGMILILLDALQQLIRTNREAVIQLKTNAS
jgi:HK97 family phage major capsid protein